MNNIYSEENAEKKSKKAKNDSDRVEELADSLLLLTGNLYEAVSDLAMVLKQGA